VVSCQWQVVQVKAAGKEMAVWCVEEEAAWRCHGSQSECKFSRSGPSPGPKSRSVPESETVSVQRPESVSVEETVSVSESGPD